VNAPLNEFQTQYNNLLQIRNLDRETELNNNGFTGFKIEGSQSRDLTIDQIDPNHITDVTEFYTTESEYHYCYLLKIASSGSEEVLTIDQVTKLLTILLEVGTEVSDLIAKEKKAGKSNEEIIQNPGDILIKLESYLRSSTQLRAYRNVRQ
jgi:hypothetical protein